MVQTLVQPSICSLTLVSPSESSDQPGNGKKAVLIDYFDPTNLSEKWEYIPKIRFVQASSAFRMIGHINFNSTSKRRLTQTPYKQNQGVGAGTGITILFGGGGGRIR